jgi:hypothetical protein
VREVVVSPLSMSGSEKLPVLSTTCHWLDWCVSPPFGSEKALPLSVTPVAERRDAEVTVGVLGAAFEAAPVVKFRAALQELQFPLLSRYRTLAL